MPAWMKLDGPHTSLNAPNVHPMQLTKNAMIPWPSGSADTLRQVDVASRHLVINCHGIPAPPDLHLGVGLTLNNVNAFDAIGLMPKLRVIWISACNLAGSSDGLLMCKEMARRAGAYVVSAVAPVLDLRSPPGCVEDHFGSVPVYIDPFGDGVSRDAFLGLGGKLGFRRT